jgi:hypothetical protein
MYLCSCPAKSFHLKLTPTTRKMMSFGMSLVNWGPIGWNSLRRAKRLVDLLCLRPHS